MPDEDSSPATYADRVRGVLAQWNGQHEYKGASWRGLEELHQMLASVAGSAAVQAPTRGPWYKYAGSLRDDMDGRDWRLVLLDPEGGFPVTVNCHSLLHDDLWTLTTTVFSTAQLDTTDLLFVGDPDQTRRAVRWTLAVVNALGVQGYEYSEVRSELRARLAKQD